MGTFKLVKVMMGSGWPSAHVALNEYITYPDKAGGAEWLLTPDSDSPADFAFNVDELIAELEALKVLAKDKFQQWEKPTI